MKFLDYCMVALIALILAAMFAYGWSTPGSY